MMPKALCESLVKMKEVTEILETYLDEHKDCSLETYLAFNEVIMAIINLDPDAYIFDMTGEVIKCRKEKTA